jgi:diaminohydroxyphosphoribosylaminopyrimidine deaminase/5-amino-6-(5-phosphoribosylamino)uracil reductase
VRAEAEELNEVFFHFIATGMPFVTWKYAMSLDGRIAHTDRSPWRISGAASHERVQRDRARSAAVITGIGTVLADDPRLTARPARPVASSGIHQPVRVIVDSQLRTPLASAVVRESAADGLTLIVTCAEPAGSADSVDSARQQQNRARVAAYERAGCEVVTLPSDGHGHVSIPAVMEELGRRRLDSAYLEAGGILAAAFLEAHAVHRIEAFIAPVVLGASHAPSPAMGERTLAEETARLPRIGNPTITRYDNDILIEGRI